MHKNKQVEFNLKNKAFSAINPHYNNMVNYVLFELENPPINDTHQNIAEEIVDTLIHDIISIVVGDEKNGFLPKTMSYENYEGEGK
mgnify:FL=1|tara:strand:- start:353 stop:610 length:258 start_codon:yes stop_codon:yes gene_type:complete